MSSKSIEQSLYERGWGQCTRCGCRRPLRELGAELAGEERRFVCLDTTWCDRISIDRRKRAEHQKAGLACAAHEDCPEPREQGSSYCFRHRPVNPEGPPAPAARARPEQALLPFDDE